MRVVLGLGDRAGGRKRGGVGGIYMIAVEHRSGFQRYAGCIS